MDAALRQQRARLGGLTTSMRGTGDTESGRRAAEARFLRDVLAEAEAAGEHLTESEALRRAAARRRLFFSRLALTSAKARRARASQRRYGLTPRLDEAALSSPNQWRTGGRYPCDSPALAAKQSHHQ